MKKSIRLLSFVMMILILVVSLPMYAFAMGIDTEAEEITVDNDEETIREEIIDEIINSVNNIKENYDAIEEIQKVCEEIFNTNTKEFDDLFKDLKL